MNCCEANKRNILTHDTQCQIHGAAIRHNFGPYPWDEEEVHALNETIREMMFPVRCVCGSIYDLARVEVIQRYMDCSVWVTKCCGRTADDRKGLVKHYTEIPKKEY